jgi:hypothetical protein
MVKVKGISIYTIVLRSGWWRDYYLMRTKWYNSMDYEANEIELEKGRTALSS